MESREKAKLPIEEKYENDTSIRLMNMSRKDNLGPKTAEFLAAKTSLNEIIYNVHIVEDFIEKGDRDSIGWMRKHGAAEFIKLVEERVRIKEAVKERDKTNATMGVPPTKFGSSYENGNSYVKPFSIDFDEIDGRISAHRAEMMYKTLEEALETAKKAKEPEGYVMVLLNYNARLLRNGANANAHK